MRYKNICRGVFLARPNRFIARVEIDGQPETVHVKNTGRCRELLMPGAEVWLAKSDNPARKTKYDLVAVRKDTGVLFNIDSQAPNAVTGEWLARQGFDKILPEYRFGQSRIDFSMERGVRHLKELARAAAEGWQAAVAFVMQAEGMALVRPNAETDPAFAAALEAAEQAGVRILCLPCHVEPDRLEIVTDETL